MFCYSAIFSAGVAFVFIFVLLLAGMGSVLAASSDHFVDYASKYKTGEMSNANVKYALMAEKEAKWEIVSFWGGLGGLGLTLLGMILAMPLFTGVGLLVSLVALGLAIWLRFVKKWKGKKLRWALISSGLSLFFFLTVGGLILFF